MEIVQNQDEDPTERSRRILRKNWKSKDFNTSAVLTKLCKQSKDIIDEFTFKKLVVNSALKLDKDELFED